MKRTPKNLITDEVENILAIYREATPDEREFGLQWYRKANGVAKDFAELYGLRVSQVAAIIAALSPNCSWTRNVIDARNLIFAYAHRQNLLKVTVTSYPLNKMKAIKILNGVRPLSVLRGPKVRSFYKCIMYPEKALAVCVDFHSVNIARGVYETMQQSKPIKPKTYAYYAECYRAAAQKLNLAPHDLQATVWVTWRRMHVTRDNGSLFLKFS